MSDKQTAPILPPLNGGGGNNGGSNGGASQQTVNLQQVLATAQGLNVLTTGAGQQFVITSQVPGLTQVISSSATTNSNIQQVGVTRIVNISATPPRATTVGVAGAISSPLTSPTRQNSPKVVLATSPKLVRTSIANMFVAPTSQSPMQSPPARKKLKLTDTTEKPTMIADDAMGYRRRIMEHKMKRMRAIREKYAENASELFFLHAGGNMMDFQTWRKRPPTPQYLHFLRQHRLDPDDDDEDLTAPLPAISEIPLTPTATTVSTIVPVNQCTTEGKISGLNVAPVAVSTTLPAAVAQLSQQGHIPGRPQGGRHGMVFAFRAAIQSSPVTVHPPPTSTLAPTLIIGNAPMIPGSPKSITTASSPVVDKSTIATTITTTITTMTTPTLSLTGTTTTTTATVTTVTSTTTTTTTKTSSAPSTPTQPVVKLVKLPSSNSTASCDMTNNQEQIVEKAKQEAYVMQRIAELQREGLWSERRLPKVQEPPRTKAHWDYLLEEMVWLAADFAQERKWKKAAAKKCARMVQKYFQEKAIQAQKAEKSQELRLKKIASFIAKEIKTFWANVEKLVEYKQQTRLEEKRKQALDQHLNFIVGQTEKYSTWLTEGLNKTDGPQSIPASMNSSRISSPVPPGKSHSDEDFQPNQSSDDDEETIAKAEEELKSVTNHKEEVELLKKESEIPLEDLLKDLPPDYLEHRSKSLSPTSKEVVEDENEKTADADTDFVAASDESSDEEETIMEQEKLEENTDYKQELDDLKTEGEMSIDELMAKYGSMSNVPMDAEPESVQESDKESTKEDEAQENEEESTSNESESEATDNEVGEEESQAHSDNEADVGLKSLLEDVSMEKSADDKTADMNHSNAHDEMDNVAALAESIQPKGNTLLTTSVVTKIPFLLKHSLREYQHIGLDWLVTMYDRKLNGILADEMGLGKTIQTIALLAHLACEKGNWGPHLIIVPTSVMLNWEMECKKWCPGFKILTYYGTQKERKQKRTGWTKPNAFHICITSYKLVIQDHQSFRRKKWKYLILDEAQNIKNFKSQRWQLLLNFQTQRRLLLTGTPLQNNLMELWSLMHFLMPNVFQSHREFKEWFSNPVTGMIEGNSEYNENIIRRLHKVLRPFLLRRLKTEVEKQLPKKYEHVLMCRLSKRQRYLYDDFMSRAKTKETLASGNLLSVINVLMQLRKVCNHPNLFEVRPTVSPFQMEAIEFVTASLVWSALDYDPFKHIDLSSINLLLCDLESTLTAFAAHRVKRLQTPRKLIEEIDTQPDPPPRCPSGKIKINVRLSNQVKPPVTPQPTQTKLKNLAGILPTPRVGTSPLIKTANNQSTPGQGVTLKVASGQQFQGYSVQLVQHQGSVKAIPVGTLAHNPQSTTVTSTTAATNAQRITVGNANIRDGLQRLATQTVTVKQGDSVQRIAVPSFAQVVQTSTGRHIILTSNQQNTNTVSFPVVTPSGQRLTVLSKSLMGLSTSATTVNKVIGGVVTTSSGTSGRPVMRVPPLNVTASQAQSPASNGQSQQQPIRCGIVTRHAQKETEKAQTKERPKSEFYLPQLEEERKQRRQAKLRLLANINERRCAACPLYGEDLFIALRIGKPSTACRWHNGWVHCATAKDTARTRRQFFSRTEALAEAINSTEQIVEELKEVFERFVVHVPAVCAPTPRFHVSHPPPHKLFGQRRMQMELQRQLSPKLALFHPVASAMMTQFPDPRLIQYDCGKLQSLDRLLRKLKSENHRVLIFTQMTRMLDVLEAFLNFHGHIYLRLDGTTRVDQRQVLMERFNGDKRIFCFILSTRSGGVGVNLTGADTVIFYDSDWNPTMDAQAQDRCHRIGQTRDVHIYRLVSEKTVEENILKKANQKRLLGDLAIEGGNFTTAYFKSSTIQDLFNIDQSENDASTRMAEVLDQNRDREKFLQKDSQGSTVDDKVAMGALESALAAAEEDLDVQAAKTAKAEAVADLAEFDENIPLDDAERDDMQVSKAEQEVQNLVSQLTPIERYAMKFVEESEGAFSAAQLAAAERELEEQKKEWELDRLRALREEEERRMRLADDDEKPLTFGREDAQNQVNSTSNSKKLVNKKLPPNRRRNSRKNVSKSAQESESETETTTESESESQEDVVEDSLDEESSHTESQSQGDEDEEEESNDQNDSEKGGYPKRKNRSNKSFSQNHFDLNSPRTRSRGNVKINLWTLDVSPILPGMKPKCRGRASNLRKQRELEMRMKTEESFVLPLPPPTSSPKKLNNSNAASKTDEEDDAANEKDLKSASPDSKRVDPEQTGTCSPTRISQGACCKVENCRIVENHRATSSPRLKLRFKLNRSTTDESVSIVSSSDSVQQADTRSSLQNSSERSEDQEAEVIDEKTSRDPSEEHTRTENESSVCITRSTHNATELNNLVETEDVACASCDEDSEDSILDENSRSSEPCLPPIGSVSTLKRISEASRLQSSMTLDIDEEISVSENSLAAPLKNKMIVEETEGTVAEKLNDSISLEDDASSVDEASTESLEEEASNVEPKTSEDEVMDDPRDTSVSVDESSAGDEARIEKSSESMSVDTDEKMDVDEALDDEATSEQPEESIATVHEKNDEPADDNAAANSVIESSSSQPPDSCEEDKCENVDSMRESDTVECRGEGEEGKVNQEPQEETKEETKAVPSERTKEETIVAPPEEAKMETTVAMVEEPEEETGVAPAEEPKEETGVAPAEEPKEETQVVPPEELKEEATVAPPEEPTEGAKVTPPREAEEKPEEVPPEKPKEEAEAVDLDDEKLQMEAKMAVEPEESNTEAKVETKMVVEPEASKMETKMVVEPEESKTETKVETKMVGEPEESKTETKVETKMVGEPEESKTETKVETKMLVEPEESKTETKVEVDQLEGAKEETKRSAPSKQSDSDPGAPTDSEPKAPRAHEPSTEVKVRFRKPEITSCGVTTRSAKQNLHAEHSEGKHSATQSSSAPADGIQSSDQKSSQATEVPTSPSNAHRKESNHKIRRPDTPRPPTEHGRITRSSAAGRSVTPPPPINPNGKSVQRKRPDTPFPDCQKSSPRPATRSTSSLNSPSRNEEQNTYEKPTTRSSKSLDNGFLSPSPIRRSSSIPPMKTVAEPKDSPATISTRSKKNSESGGLHTSTPRRRPDTPVPNIDQVPRVTRSGLNFTLNSSGKSSPNHVAGRGHRHGRKTESSETKSQEEESAASSPKKSETDTNGNAVVSETFAKQGEPVTEVHEKPQRTAKVVAILTLDTRSNHMSKASSSVHGTKSSNCNSTDSRDSRNNKKNADASSESSGKNCVHRLTDGSSNNKMTDGWCTGGPETGGRDRVSSNVLSNVAGTYTNSNKQTGKATGGNRNASNNSKVKTDKVSLPVKSTVIAALVDLDNDPNYDSTDGSKRLRRKIKRTRLSSLVKPLAGGKSNESQMTGDALDDEEQIPPLKKSVRSSQLPPPPPPPPSTQTAAQLEKISGGTIS